MRAPEVPPGDAEAGERLLRRLDEVGVRPHAALWLWDDEAGRWRYVLAKAPDPTRPDPTAAGSGSESGEGSEDSDGSAPEAMARGMDDPLGDPFGEVLAGLLAEPDTPRAEQVEVRSIDDPVLAALGRRVQIGGVSRVGLRADDNDGVPLPPCLVYRLQLAGPGEPRRRPRRPRRPSARVTVIEDGPDTGVDRDRTDARRARRAARVDRARERREARIEAARRRRPR